MSAVSANISRQLSDLRRRETGQPILFGGVVYYGRVESISGAKAGVNGLPATVKTLFQQYEASLDPVVIMFSPQDFRSAAHPELPLAPMEGDELTINQLIYQVTAFTFDNAGGRSVDALTLPVFALRKIY